MTSLLVYSKPAPDPLPLPCVGASSEQSRRYCKSNDLRYIVLILVFASLFVICTVYCHEHAVVWDSYVFQAWRQLYKVEDLQLPLDPNNMVFIPVILAAASLALAQAPTTPPSTQTGRLPALGCVNLLLSRILGLNGDLDGTPGMPTVVVSSITCIAEGFQSAWCRIHSRYQRNESSRCRQSVCFSRPQERRLRICQYRRRSCRFLSYISALTQRHVGLLVRKDTR